MRVTSRFGFHQDQLDTDLAHQEEKFAKDVHDFSTDNDLIRDPIKRREMVWRDEIEGLKVQQRRLEEGKQLQI